MAQPGMQAQWHYMEARCDMTSEIIINVETGQVVERPYSDEELKAFELEKKKNDELSEKLDREEKAKTSARQAILDRLGLTEEEARLLLG